MNGKDRYQGLAPYYDILIDWDKRLATEMPFLLEIAGVRWKSSARVLDIGCGSGRHLRALRDAGCEVEGAEPSARLRKLAEINVPGALLHPRGMEHLDRLAARRGPWDLVLCLGNTLAHLPVKNLDRFTAALVRSVGGSGTAVLHILNYEKILSRRPRGLPEKTVRRGEDTWRFAREYDYLEGSLEFTVRVWRNDLQVAENHETLYPLTASRLTQSAAAAGFTRIDAFGGFNQANSFTPESDNLVLVLSSGAVDRKTAESLT